MSVPVRFSDEASSEFEEAAAWYEERRLGLGGMFIDAVEAAVALLASWPRSGAPVDGLTGGHEVRRAPVFGFSYHLAYLVAEDHLRVLAVAHDRRRPRYWAQRAAP